MLQKDGSIILNNFQLGQSESPYFGYAKMQNIELANIPGIAQIQRKLALSHSTDGLPLAIIRDNSSGGTQYVGTSAGTLYRNGSVLVSSLGIVYDLLIHKGYLLVFRDTAIDVMDLSTLNYTSGWKTGLETGYYHKAVNDPDNDIYITNGPYIAKITSFAAGSPPTATLTATEKTLPTGQYAQTLAMLGIYLGIGTQGGLTYTDVSKGIAQILFWDRASGLFEDGFINYAESGVLAMFNIGNSLLVAAGTSGNIYETNGVSADPIKTINFNTNKNSTAFVYPNAIARTDKEILIGTSTHEDGFPSKATHGVWSVKKGTAFLRNTISTGAVGEDQTLEIGAIYAHNSGVAKSIVVGWQDGSSYGVDEISPTLLYSTFPTIIESEMHIVGDALNGKTYGQLEYLVGRPLITGQTITVYYRTASDDDYTELYEFTAANTDGRNSQNTTVDVPTCETIQLRAELAQSDSVGFGNNIDLISLKLKV